MAPERPQRGLLGLAPASGSGRASAQAAARHHVVHPHFTLQLQSEPLALSLCAAEATAAGPAVPGLAGVEVWVEEAPGRPCLEVEVTTQG